MSIIKTRFLIIFFASGKGTEFWGVFLATAGVGLVGLGYLLATV